MTTNQTIDGVPRELLLDIEYWLKHMEAEKGVEGRCMALKELRALLDAPASIESLVVRNGGGMVWHECAVCHAKGSYHPDVKWCICGRPFDVPAAQPQGEPVAWMDPRSPEMHATISNEVKQHNLKFGGAPSAAVNGYSIPLYAEQPAPVAVPRLEMAHVVRAHMEIPGCPVLTSNQCHALAMKLNESLKPSL